MEKKATEVVAALIWDGDRFLVWQRPAHKARGLLWEFVGGKVEPGETKEEALIRECQEELAVTISVGEVFMEVVYCRDHQRNSAKVGTFSGAWWSSPSPPTHFTAPVLRHQPLSPSTSLDPVCQAHDKKILSFFKIQLAITLSIGFFSVLLYCSALRKSHSFSFSSGKRQEKLLLPSPH